MLVCIVPRCSEVFSGCVAAIESAVESVSGEMNQMCSQYSWLNDVCQFISTWEGKEKVACLSAEEYKVRAVCRDYVIRFCESPICQEHRAVFCCKVLALATVCSFLLYFLQGVLSKLHSWAEQVSRLPPRLLTSHSLLSVSTVSVVEVMGPQLATVLEQLTSVGMQRALGLCTKVLEDIRQRVEVSTFTSF